jgi:haloalkane dehalogenase
MFVERVLPDLVLPQLSDLEMAEYRRPFLKSEDRWPTLTWARQIPIAGTPADVVAIAAATRIGCRITTCPSCSSTLSSAQF